MAECLINLDYNLIIAFSSAVTAVFSGAVFFIYYKQWETQKKQLVVSLVSKYEYSYSELRKIIKGIIKRKTVTREELFAINDLKSHAELYLASEINEEIYKILVCLGKLHKLYQLKENPNYSGLKMLEVSESKDALLDEIAKWNLGAIYKKYVNVEISP